MSIPRRNKEENLYNELQAESLRMIQKLSGKRWTDFNQHDPGITLMDLLNYALLELHYQLELDFEQFLANPADGLLSYEQLGLLPGSEIFAPCRVTPSDYENLIKDHFKGAVSECKVELMAGNRYRIHINTQVPTESLISEVRRVYHQHRNLCETLEGVYIENGTVLKSSARSPEIALEYEQEYEVIQIKEQFPEMAPRLKNELPDCYGVNEHGLAWGASDQRRAQASQLKAYLLIFDFILSGNRRQLRSLYQQLNLSEQVPKPFLPLLDPEEADLLVDETRLKQTALFKKEEQHRLKAAWFDVLDTLYGEDTHFVEILYPYDPEECNRLRAQIIRQFPSLNTRRFCSFNLLDEKLESMPGIKCLMHTLWNNQQRREVPLVNLFGRYNLRLVSDDVFCKEMQVLFDMRYLADEFELVDNKGNVTTVPRIALSYSGRKFDLLRKRLNFFTHNILFESFLVEGTRPENYRMETLDNGYLLLYRHPERKRWITMGYFTEKEILIQTANLLWGFLEMLNNESTTFYLLEHLLLKEGTASEEECNTLSLIVPAWKKEQYVQKKYLEQLLERLPVHLDIRLIWMDAQTLYNFEQHYYAWRKAWATQNQTEIQNQSEVLKKIVE